MFSAYNAIKQHNEQVWSSTIIYVKSSKFINHAKNVWTLTNVCRKEIKHHLQWS